MPEEKTVSLDVSIIGLESNFLRDKSEGCQKDECGKDFNLPSPVSFPGINKP